MKRLLLFLTDKAAYNRHVDLKKRETAIEQSKLRAKIENRKYYVLTGKDGYYALNRAEIKVLQRKGRIKQGSHISLEDRAVYVANPSNDEIRKLRI